MAQLRKGGEVSTDYVPRTAIPYSRLPELGALGIKIQDAVNPPCPRSEACVLTDGIDHLWARVAKNSGTTFTRYGANDPSAIIEAIESHFGTELVSEYDDDFDTIVDAKYPDDFIVLPLPTDESPGPWRRVYPP